MHTISTPAYNALMAVERKLAAARSAAFDRAKGESGYIESEDAHNRALAEGEAILAAMRAELIAAWDAAKAEEIASGVANDPLFGQWLTLGDINPYR